jgi:hypothetical protein
MAKLQPTRRRTLQEKLAYAVGYGEALRDVIDRIDSVVLRPGRDASECVKDMVASLIVRNEKTVATLRAKER